MKRLQSSRPRMAPAARRSRRWHTKERGHSCPRRPRGEKEGWETSSLARFIDRWTRVSTLHNGLRVHITLRGPKARKTIARGDAPGMASEHSRPGCAGQRAHSASSAEPSRLLGIGDGSGASSQSHMTTGGPMPAPTGRTTPAQGTALGSIHVRITSPERATQRRKEAMA